MFATPWPGSIKSLGRNQRSFKVDGNRETVTSGLREHFSRRLFRADFKAADSGALVGFAQRGDIWRFGSILMHFGLISMVLGGLVSNLFGFTIHMWGKPGDTLKAPGAPFELRVDDFVVERDERDRISDYLCTLTVLEQENEILTKVIEVNHPLRYRGYNFYQSDWRQIRADNAGSFQVHVARMEEPNVDTTLVVPYRKRVPIGDGVNWIEVSDYYPDFFIGSDRKPGTRSADPKNPAIRLAVFPGQTDSSAAELAWAFQKFPDAHMGGSGKYTFHFIGDMRPVVNLTGLQVSKSPGTPLIWLGIIFSSLGLMFAFFIPYRRYLFYIEPDQSEDRWVVNISGQRLRGAPMSRQELSHLIEAVSGQLTGAKKKGV
jgi:cytochrome c biogenesis protein